MGANVSRVTNPNEIEEAQMRMMKVRFDCIVKMYDSGSIEFGDRISGRTLPPQWFKSELKLTLEFLRDAEPVDIGLAIKQALAKMDEAISLYEQIN